MCGRYANSRSDTQLRNEFAVTTLVGDELAPSYNVAPTHPVRAVLDHHSDDTGLDRQLRTLRWGLVPFWAKDPTVGNRMINARLETVTEKPAYKQAARKRRCIVPADGYFEWQQPTDGGTKTPWFLHDPTCEGLGFGGLYELWRDPTRADDDPHRWLWSVTIITHNATDTLGHIHDRMPLLIPAHWRDTWLDPALTDPEHIQGMLAAIPELNLTPYTVSTAVNNVRNNRPELLEPADTSN